MEVNPRNRTRGKLHSVVENIWFRWFEEKFVSIGQNVQRNFPQLLIQHLDEIRAVLPIGSWVDVSARSIASAGA